LSKREWGRFQLHAKHVRSLSPGDLESTCVEFFSLKFIESLLQLSRAGQSTQLLPALKQLDWIVDSSENLSTLSHILSPTVEELSLFILEWDDEADCHDLLETLEVLSPPLKNLRLWFDPDVDDYIADLAKHISPIFKFRPGIEHLATDTLLFVHMLHCSPALFSDITTLRLEESHGWGPPEVGPDVPNHQNILPNLLSITGRNIQFWNFFLPVTCQTIEIVFLANLEQLHTTPEEIRTFIEVVGKSCPRLRKFVLGDVTFVEDPGPMNGLLSPLSKCPHISDIIIECSDSSDIIYDFSYSLSDDEVAELAKAWPRLRSFAFGCQPKKSVDKPPLTLNAIHSLRKHCPKLRRVCLTVDGSCPPNNPPAAKAAPMLEALVLGHSVVTDPVAVAVWLQSVCDADYILWSDWEDDPRRGQMMVDMQMFTKHLQKTSKKFHAQEEELEKQRLEIVEMQEKVELMIRKLEKRKLDGFRPDNGEGV
jgi:hypothetical protein